MIRRFAIAAVLLTSLAACATNPATGQRQLSLVGEQQEIQMGREASVDVARQMGLYDNRELQEYVNSLGKQIAASSERPNLPWEFHVVDDPMVNAFALPGGYIYVTRGILAHFNDEAELVSVLGHEIGHVTGRHSVEQISKQQLAGLGLGIAMILSPQAAQLGDLASAGLQLMFLKFSRDDEKEADDLGLRYMTRGGWDPDRMPPVFDILSAMSKTQEGGKVPEWASTHPDPENRAGRLRAQIEKLPNREGKVNAESYIRRLNGVMFGVNPREGYNIGSTFIHPDLGFRMQFPQGWKIQNTKQAVVAVSPQGDAITGITLAQGNDPRTEAQKFFNQQGIQVGQEFQRNFFTFQTAQTQQGAAYAGVVGWVQQRGQTLQVLGYTTAGNFNRYSNVLAQTASSFQQETNPRYLNVEPKRVEIVRVPRAMSIEEFSREFPSTVDIQTLAIVNGLVREGGRFEAGQYAKRIVGGSLPRE
jgi:predicted Zn-dependent protease